MLNMLKLIVFITVAYIGEPFALKKQRLSVHASDSTGLITGRRDTLEALICATGLAGAFPVSVKAHEGSDTKASKGPYGQFTVGETVTIPLKWCGGLVNAYVVSNAPLTMPPV